MESTSSVCPLQHAQADLRSPLSLSSNSTVFLPQTTSAERCQQSPQPLLPSQLDTASLWPWCKCMPRSLGSDAPLIIQNTCWQRPLCLLSPLHCDHALSHTHWRLWPCQYESPAGLWHWGGSPYTVPLFWLCCSRHPWQLMRAGTESKAAAFEGQYHVFLPLAVPAQQGICRLGRILRPLPAPCNCWLFPKAPCCFCLASLSPSTNCRQPCLREESAIPVPTLARDYELVDPSVQCLIVSREDLHWSFRGFTLINYRFIPFSRFFSLFTPPYQ